MSYDPTNKACECGRPAVKRTAGHFVCQRCADIQHQQVAAERSAKLKALQRVWQNAKYQDSKIYQEPFKVYL